MRKGFTIFELLLVISLLMILSGVLIALINPAHQMGKGRDLKKLSDLSKFETLINDSKIDNGFYPDTTPPDNVSYYHTVATYELDTDLEYFTDKEQNDGGNNSALYEVGNDLTLN